MTTTLVLPEHVAAEIETVARYPLETAGVVLASHLEAYGGDIRLLGRRFCPVSENAYVERSHDRPCIASEGYVHALSEAEQLGALAIWFHTHPGEGSAPLASRGEFQTIQRGEIQTIVDTMDKVGTILKSFSPERSSKASNSISVRSRPSFKTIISRSSGLP